MLALYVRSGHEESGNDQEKRGPGGEGRQQGAQATTSELHGVTHVFRFLGVDDFIATIWKALNTQYEPNPKRHLTTNPAWKMFQILLCFPCSPCHLVLQQYGGVPLNYAVVNLVILMWGWLPLAMQPGSGYDLAHGRSSNCCCSLDFFSVTLLLWSRLWAFFHIASAFLHSGRLTATWGIQRSGDLSLVEPALPDDVFSSDSIILMQSSGNVLFHPCSIQNQASPLRRAVNWWGLSE